MILFNNKFMHLLINTLWRIGEYLNLQYKPIQISELNMQQVQPQSDYSDSQLDQQVQQQAHLSKLENMTNFLKQIVLHVSATIKSSEIREQTRNVILGFDKSIEQYNSCHIRQRINRLTYFKIDSIDIFDQKDVFFVKKVEKDVSQSHVINLMFVKDPNSTYFRMHPEIWKKEKNILTTNKILAAQQRNCINYIHYFLSSRGFVSHQEGLAIVLNSKKATYDINTQIDFQQSNLMKAILEYTNNFLTQMTYNLSQEVPCKFCNTFLLYDAKKRMMMPPTVMLILVAEKERPISREKQRRVVLEEKTKNTEVILRIYHDTCSLYDYKQPTKTKEQVLKEREARQTSRQRQ